MMREVKAYQSEDGQTFQTKREAAEHEAKVALFDMIPSEPPGNRSDIVSFIMDYSKQIYNLLSPIVEADRPVVERLPEDDWNPDDVARWNGPGQ